MPSINLPPSFAEVHARHLVLMAFGAVDVHREQFAAHGDKYGREIAAMIRRGQGFDPATYRSALEHQQQFRQAMSACFSEVDVLITPATATPAPTAETTGDSKFNSPWSYSRLPTVSLPYAMRKVVCRCRCSSLAASVPTKICCPPRRGSNRS